MDSFEQRLHPVFISPVNQKLPIFLLFKNFLDQKYKLIVIFNREAYTVAKLFQVALSSASTGCSRDANYWKYYFSALLQIQQNVVHDI